MVRAAQTLCLGAALCATLGAGCMLEDAFPRRYSTPEKQARAEDPSRPKPPPHEERDPVAPGARREMGFHYDPAVFEQGAYKPDELENMIDSKGFDGLSQHSFTSAGGDFDVDVAQVQGEPMMAYASTRYSHNADICLQSTKGKAVTLFSSDAADDLMPKFAPGGRHVAWCSNRYGNWDILVSPTQRTEQTRPQQVTDSSEDEIHPAWSPDAVWSPNPNNAAGLLAFSRYDSMSGVWRIWILDIRTRSVSAITEGLFPVFRPMAEQVNGKTVHTILYQKSRKRDIPWYSIWSIRIAAGENGKVEVVDSPVEIISNDKWAAINPAWSPDGKYVAFASVRKSPSAQWQARVYRADDVWVVRRDGTDLTQITSHAAPDWSPCWAAAEGDPAGRIYFNSLRNGHENIWSAAPLVAGLLE